MCLSIYREKNIYIFYNIDERIYNVHRYIIQMPVLM